MGHPSSGYGKGRSGGRRVVNSAHDDGRHLRSTHLESCGAVDMRARLRQVANLVNLSTPLGLLVARVGGAATRAGPDGLVLAAPYQLPVPPAAAFTVGNVVLHRGVTTLTPPLLRHEARHATQWAWCLGLPFLPLYLLASAWSWLRTGDPATGNIFERRAGLADGGYGAPTPRRAGSSV